MVETTGAGDAFVGGFAAALADGADPLEAARFGSATAGISVTRAGTAPAMPRRAEIEALLRERSLRMTRNDPIKYVFIWPAAARRAGDLDLSADLFADHKLHELPPDAADRRRASSGFDNYIAPAAGAALLECDLTRPRIIAFIAVGLQYVIGFGVALALNARVPGERLFRVAFLLPMLLAPVAVALIARADLQPDHGTAQPASGRVRSAQPAVPHQTHWALGAIIAVEVWQWTPFVILMMLAGLQTLPDDVYEAAALENASAWQQFWGITFPMMLPISAAVVFIRLIESYKIIDTVFVMTGGGPGVDTETLTLFAYQEGFKKFNLGYTSALSFLFLIVITIIGVTYLAILRPHLEKRR